MMRSFTTVVVILAATLSLATADFKDYMILIARGDDKNEADCTPVVNEEICDVIEKCVADATGKHLHPTRKNDDPQRMLKTSMSASRQLDELDLCDPDDPNYDPDDVCCLNSCSLQCQFMGYWCACSNCNPVRRLEEEFIESDAVQSISRELTPEEHGILKTECKQAAINYARDSGNKCLGNHTKIDVIVKTSA